MLKRIIAGLLGLMNAGNGLIMLFDGQNWYHRVPGVTHTGPYNPHFVQDIGIAFLAASAGLLAAAWRPRYWPAAAAGAAFIAGHGLLHLIGILQGHSHTVPFDTAMILIPSALAIYAALPPKGSDHA